MIYRRAKFGKSGRPRSIGPNTTLYCVECEKLEPNGYELRSLSMLGPGSFFVCDHCLNQAKSGGRYGNKLIDHYSEG